MGIRSQLGLLLLCLTILATSLVQSCNREPEPTAIDLAQPTLQKPPVELWRKRVVTKPPSKKERDKIMENYEWDKMAKAEGWTLARSPILLLDGNILVVTSNRSIDTGSSGRPEWAGKSSLFDEHTMYRLVIVSNKGKIKLHQEFRWASGARVVRDPSGEYLVFVVQDNYSPASLLHPEESGEKTISALDKQLDTVLVLEVGSPDIKTSTFVVSESMMVWESRETIEGTQMMTYACELVSMNRDGSLAWKHKLPDEELLSASGMYSPFTLDSDGNIILCNSDQNLYFFSPGGKLVWKKPLDYSFKTHPVLLAGGQMALVGDKSHKVLFPGLESLMPDFEDYGTDDYSPPDLEELKRQNESFMREIEKYQRELLSLKGFMFVLNREGKVLTKKKLPSFPNSGPVVIDDTKLLLNIAAKINYPSRTDLMAIIDVSSRLMCITVEGEILWDRSFDTHFIEGGIQVVDLPGGQGKCILAAGDDGNLYCLDESGELLWVITGTNINPHSLAVGSDGLIYVVAGGELVCYSTGDISGGSSSGLSMILPGSTAFGS